MLDIIAETFPRLVATLTRKGMARRDAARLVMAARFGGRGEVWSAEDCDRARELIRRAFITRNRRLRLQMEG